MPRFHVPLPDVVCALVAQIPTPLGICGQAYPSLGKGQISLAYGPLNLVVNSQERHDLGYFK